MPYNYQNCQTNQTKRGLGRRDNYTQNIGNKL